MAQLLQSRVQKLVNIISSLLLFWVLSWVGYAQTTLIPGDIFITTINASNSTIELVPLIDLERETEFTIKVGSDSNLDVLITIKNEVRAGNSIFITGQSNEQIEIEGELNVAIESDQLTILQKDGEYNRLLFIASYGKEGESLGYSQIQEIPSIQIGLGLNHQYYLKNGASGTKTMISNMISDPANWKSSDKAFGQLRTSFRLLSAPVIVFDQNISTVMEGDSIPLNVAIYEHDGSRLTVDVILNEDFSTADTNDIHSFRSYTYNFTGLIGNAVYEVAVQQFDDSFFEDRETVFFELRNLSAGTFGDFVNHVSFIVDNEIPEVSIISANNGLNGSEDYLVIQNSERVYVNIENWSFKSGEDVFQLTNPIDLAPLETRLVLASELIKADAEGDEFFEVKEGEISLVDAYGNSVAALTVDIELEQQKDISDRQTERINLEFDITQSIVQSVNNEVVTTAEITDEEKNELVPGWYPVDETNQEEQSESIFWDEKLARFRPSTDVGPDSLLGISLLQYITESPLESEFVTNNTDSTAEIESNEIISEWTIFLSATDSDENGYINNQEGYNFIQYRGIDSISVSDIIYQVEEQIGEGFIYPIVFKPVGQSLKQITETEFLFNKDFFWIKADSLFERTEVLIRSINREIVQDYSSNDDEAVSNFSIVTTAEDGSSSINFNFYDSEFNVPVSVIEPILDLGHDLSNNQYPILGGSIES